MAHGQGAVGEAKSAILQAIPEACRDERAAVEFLEAQRWGSEPACARCGSIAVYKMLDRKTGERSKRFLWRCKDCEQQFTVRTGTVLEDSRIPHRIWCHAFWRACSSKKGVSALQIQRETGLSYKSALFLMHRIRWAMADDPDTSTKLTGTVEADETYVGGQPRGTGRGKGYTVKTPVFAVIQRDGEMRTAVLERVTAENMPRNLRRFVDLAQARLITDEAHHYKAIGREFAGGHESVKHSAHEYVRGDVTTNTVEGFFGLLKRGLHGTFHSVSKRHLHRYCSEFEFRWNTRKTDDGARMGAAIRKSQGRRLRYLTLTQGG
jgi:transposase-like protein